MVPFGPISIHAVQIAIAVLIAVVSAVYPGKQEPHHDPYAKRSFMSGEWWWHPLESDSTLRGTLISGDLQDLFVRTPRDGAQEETVWLVGSGGLILQISDDGTKWAQKEIDPGQPAYLPTGAPLLPALAGAPETQGAVQVQESPQGDDTAEQAAQLSSRIATLQNEIQLTDERARAFGVRLQEIDKQEAGLFLENKLDPGAREKLLALAQKDATVASRDFGVDPKFVEQLLELERLRQDYIAGGEQARRESQRLQVSLREQEVALQALSQPSGNTAQAEEVPAQVEEAPDVFLPASNVTPAEHLTRDLHAITFVGESGWAVGEHGVIVRTADGGETWALQTIGSADHDLYDIAFTADGRLGWAVGSTGIFETRDGGETWRRAAAPADAALTLNSVAVFGDILVVAAGDDGALFRSGVAGEGWERLESNTDEDFVAVLPISEEYSDAAGAVALTVGEAGDVVFVGGSEVDRESGIELEPGQSISGVWADQAGESGWLVGSGGTILHGKDEPEPRRIELNLTADLNAVVFASDEMRGWIAGDEGTVLRTQDAGSSWKQLAFGGSDKFNTESASSGLWAEEEDGRIVFRGQATGDVSSRRPGSHSYYPAPWFYLSWLVAAGFLARSVRRTPPPVREDPSVADRGFSDRPLEHGDPDPLDFGAIADAISSFLINENTQPPLTLAVSGDWGTGKSSILNLVQYNLKAARRSPIWFNAWHHQNEESLLAALLETIRHGAIPPWWTPAGWIFRCNMFWVRFQRSPYALTLLLLLFVASAGYLIVVPPSDIIPHIGQLLASMFGEETGDTGEISLLKSSPLLTAIVGLIGIWLNTRSKLGAAGLSPARLLRGSGLRASDLRDRVGFRHQFANEFRDVTDALGKMTLVVMIDDLDRCQAKNIMDTLELMNFLVSSGKCYILVGLAPEQVKTSIAKVIDNTADPGHYLEKLINIEIPVPVLSAAGAKKLMEESLQRTLGEEEPPARLKRVTQLAAAVVLVLALAGTAGWGGHWLGQHVQDEIQASRERQAQVAREQERLERAEKAEAAKRAADSGRPSTATTDDVSEDEAEATAAESQDVDRRFTVDPPRPKSFLLPGLLGDRKLWPMFLFGGLIGLMILLVLIEQARRRIVGVVHDSREFQQAIAAWSLPIQWKNTSPRGLKRFMNRLRYLAMRQRSEQERRKARGQELDAEKVLTEPALVAVSTLADVQEDTLVHLSQTGDLKSILTKLNEKEEFRLKDGGLFDDAIEHLSTGQGYQVDWPTMVDRYRQLLTDVKTS